MACFLVPTTEAVITTVATKVMKSKEEKTTEHVSVEGVSKIKFSTKMGWLNKMLWGGSALLAFEHLWHGEISPVFPFLTAVKEGETGGMLAEMSTAGVAMAVIVTAVWLGMVAVSSVIEKRTEETKEDTVG
jgi:hypothetical protein